VSAAGSYGSVAEALDHSTEPPRRVAIKRIPNVFDVFENAKRIYREVSILRVLDHPNVTPIWHLERPK
jgi:serine/threonine protein kinase